MNSETKQCQNCKNDFSIEPEDFEFYKKIDVPAPTFCPDCRLQRRMMFRNERKLYKRKCDLTGKDIVTVFAPDNPAKVFYYKDWWGDGWDQYQNGTDYDPNRPFFEQFRELQMKTPWMSLVVDPSLQDSEFVNHAGNLKDCYLVFNADFNENVLYSNIILNSQDSLECTMLDKGSLCYQFVNGANVSRCFFSQGCEESVDMYFSRDCLGCTNCFGCVNLRNKNYYIFNEPYSKEEYEQKIKEFDLGSYEVLEEILQQTQQFWLKHPVKYYWGVKNIDSTGDYIANNKNAKDMYIAQYAEDCKHCQFITMLTRDCYDVSEWGNNLELSCDAITAGDDSTGVKYCFASWSGAQNTEYCMMTPGSQDCFGCCNLKQGKYCILNKQYEKDEYFKLRQKIINDMGENPYVDEHGRAWKYGEFFPYSLSMFGYNESWASDYFPLSKEEAKTQGFNWKDEQLSAHEVTLESQNIPDHINDINETILQEVLGCASCSQAYRVVASELQLLKRLNFPIPRECPSCRHRSRIEQLNPPRLYKRTTEDGVEVMTAFAPNRPEIILSERGYQDEVM